MTTRKITEQKRTLQRLKLIALALLLVSAMGACVADHPGAEGESTATIEPAQGTGDVTGLPQTDGGPLRVVATTSIVADVVGQVGGDQIELTRLIDIGVDPHTYIPTPSDTAAVYDAHVVFASGAGLEANLEELLSSAGGNAVQVHLSDELSLLRAEEVEGQASDSAAGHGHAADEADPHVWFDVRNVIWWVGSIESTLTGLDPARAEIYTANADQYRTELQDLDGWVSSTLGEIPATNRKLVTNHPSFGYLASRYDLEQIGAVYPLSPSSQPSARDIAGLEDLIHSYGVPAIFTESTVDRRLAAQVAEDTGVKLVPLYTGSLGEAGSGAETYVEMIRYDVTAIANALR